MTFSLPWFPDGDETSPQEVSLIHRFFGDYYQTYDVLMSDNFSFIDSLLIVNGAPFFSNESKIQFPKSFIQFGGVFADRATFMNTILIERFAPDNFLKEDYALRLYLYLAQFKGYEVERYFRTTENEVNLQFPIMIEYDAIVHYLTKSDTFVVNSYSWHTERLKAGKEWSPSYPVIANTLSERLLNETDAALNVSNFSDLYHYYMSEKSWCLPEPLIIGVLDLPLNLFTESRLETANNNRWNQSTILESQGDEIGLFHIDPTQLNRPIEYNDLHCQRTNTPGRYGIEAINPQQLIDDYFLANNGMELDRTMPDSIRIKEIHAALNAGFYGNGQEKVITRKDDIYGAPEIADSTLVTIANGEDIELRYTSLAEYLGQVNYLNAALLGLHNFPIQRLPTWQPLGDATEPNLITCLSEYLIVNDYETQIKLGIYPLTTYNYAAFTDAKEPSEVVYSNSGDLLADLYALETRASVLMERSALQTYRTDINTIEIAKAIGSPFKRFEAIWDYGTTDVLQFDGAASLAMGIAGISAYLADNLANTIPLEIQQQADLRRSELMGIE